MPAAARVRADRRAPPHRPSAARLLGWSIVLLVVCTSCRAGETAPARLSSAVVDEVPLVVFDTDLGSDVDDAVALALVHRYADIGHVELAAVTISRNSEQAARYARTVNTLAGRPDVPVGIDRASPYPLDDEQSYVSLAEELGGASGALADPDASAEDAVPVLRRVLAGAIEGGRSVVLIQVGFSGNLAALLDSGPDEWSPLPGLDLVRGAGADLTVMAGSFAPPPAEVGAGVRTPGRVEFNVVQDIESARHLLATWPNDLVLAPFELGDVLAFPYAAITGLAVDDPLRRVYEFRDLEWHVDRPPFYDLRSWDLTAVVHAVEPAGGHFPISAPGTVVVDADGRTTFTPGAGRHRILEIEPMPPDARRSALARMVGLLTS